MFQFTWQNKTAWLQESNSLPICAGPPDRDVDAVGLLFWEEHCVECSAPACYVTCPLFVTRSDAKCARFRYGIVPNRSVNGLFPFGADIHFRRWAKLQTRWPASAQLRTQAARRWQHHLIRGIERAFSAAAVLLRPLSPRRRLNGLFTALRRRYVEHAASSRHIDRESADALYIKFYSPSKRDLHLNVELTLDEPVFRTKISARHGWNEHVVPLTRLPHAATRQSGRLAISVHDDAEARFIFTWLDLVRFARSSDNTQVDAKPTASDKVKCVAWDLDNTLWHGIIGDGGFAGIVPNDDMLQLVREFDRRGILQTIVSRNDHDTAWAAIEQLNLADYFLYPAIHWGPKSESIRHIADRLNIHPDSFAVIDDSSFERREIRSVMPRVRLFDPADGAGLVNRPEFDVPVTEESRTRRLKYVAESQRQRVHARWTDNYDNFLRSCNMVLRIRVPSSTDSGRCLELIQRSNQFNLSGRRYSEVEFRNLLADSRFECLCFSVDDDFGGYGIVGFAAFDTTTDDRSLVDFVLSCRVAQKRVEETFLLWYAKRTQMFGGHRLDASLVATDRNAPLCDVLTAIGFRAAPRAVEEQHRTLKQRDASSVSVDIRDTVTSQRLTLEFPPSIVVPDILRIEDDSAATPTERTNAA